MASKRILLLAAFCLAALIIAVGAYAYTFTNNTDNTNNPNTKTFFFEAKNSSAGKTYHMKMVFAIKGENLSITAEIDSTIYNPGGWLGLVFDSDHSGEIEGETPAYMFYARNEIRDPVRDGTAYRGLDDGNPLLMFASCEPFPSSLHTCSLTANLATPTRYRFP